MPCTGRTSQVLRAETSTRRQACRLVLLLSSRSWEAAEGVEVTPVLARPLHQPERVSEPPLSFGRRASPRSMDRSLAVHGLHLAAVVFGRGHARTLCH